MQVLSRHYFAALIVRASSTANLFDRSSDCSSVIGLALCSLSNTSLVGLEHSRKLEDVSLEDFYDCSLLRKGLLLLERG